MIGKKNVVFGFLYLVLTASLGPYMVVTMMPDVGAALGEKQQKVGRLQTLQTNNFEEELEPLNAEQIAKANTAGILAINKLLNSEQPVDGIKAGPHAHGNLEALLNIAAGIALCFIAVSSRFKQAISWLFIVGALTHSGTSFLVNFGFEWARAIQPLGPPLVLLALLSIGVAAAIGFKGQPVID